MRIEIPGGRCCGDIDAQPCPSCPWYLGDYDRCGWSSCGRSWGYAAAWDCDCGNRAIACPIKGPIVIEYEDDR